MEQEFNLDHLSVSQVKMFQRCPVQWYFRYVEGLKIPPRSALICGSAAHAGLEDIYRSKMLTGEFSESQTLDLTAEYVEHSDSREGEVEWDTPKAEIKDQAVGLVKAYIKEDIPDRIKGGDIQGVEKEIKLTVQTTVNDYQLDMSILGYIDLSLADRIIDFKTVSRTPSDIDPADKFQTALYCLGDEKDKAEVHYLVKTKTPKIVIPENNSDMAVMKRLATQMFIRTYLSLKTAWQTGNFLPSGVTHPWACSMCGYGEKGHCPFYAFKSSAA